MTKHLFKGTFKWAKVRKPDEEYDVWTIDVYMDDDSWEEFFDSGIQLKVRESEDGKYVTFRRRTEEKDYRTNEVLKASAPDVYVKDDQSGEYHIWKEGLVGNGSVGAVSVESFKTRNGVGHRLLRVFVDELIEYEGREEGPAPETAALPF